MTFVVLPVLSLTSLSEEGNACLDLPEDQLYDELDYNTLEEIYSRILHLSAENTIP